MDKAYSAAMQSQLTWLPELGMGHVALHDEGTYDADYWEKYRRMADSPMGVALTAARIQMVARHYSGALLDVGIGAGQFVVEREGPTFGYDVNPHAISWLRSVGLYQDLYEGRYRALSFWDALEHIPDAVAAVAQSDEWVFVSLPIFTGPEHCLSSRHYRPGEHIWYWTHDGLVCWMARQGFDLVEHNTIETDLGRDGIGSYAFRRAE